MSLNSIFQYFVPKDKKIFFPLFEQVAGNLIVMSDVLLEALNTTDLKKREELYNQIDKLENAADETTHRIYLELSKNFITPFDREDIATLTNAIDDVADYIQGSVTRMNLYRVELITPPIIKLAEIIRLSSIEIDKAVRELKDLKNVRGIADSCTRINTLESQADDVFNRAVADLFLYEKDAINLIKYQEVLANLETATDKCEDVANVLETILVKNA